MLKLITMEITHLETLSLGEFMKRVKSEAILKAKNKGSDDIKISLRKQHWMYLIENDKLTCPVTNKKVNHCCYDMYESKNKQVSYHYNFYSHKGEMFSIDHKVPISKGGDKKSSLNVQPMILNENKNKGNKLIYC